jgi:tripartite-type tricarboxylate transporter receptor subunit TctC
VTAAGAPPEALATLAAAVQAGLREPAYRARQAELGAEIVAEAEQNPAGFAAWLRRERAEIRAIADRAGIKPE